MVDKDLEDLLGPDPAAAAAEAVAVADMEVLTEAAYSGPAPFANRFLMTRHALVFRLAFVEQSAPMKNLQFRSAVSLNLDDAAELHQVLGGFLNDVRKAVGAAEPSPSVES